MAAGPVVQALWGEVDSRGREGAMNDQIAQLAREAFWGQRPNLMAHILDTQGYEMDGEWHPAYGASLDRVYDVLLAEVEPDIGVGRYTLKGLMALDK